MKLRGGIILNKTWSFLKRYPESVISYTIKLYKCFFFKDVKSRRLNASLICRPNWFVRVCILRLCPDLYAILLFLQKSPPPVVVEIIMYLKRRYARNFKSTDNGDPQNFADADEQNLVRNIIAAITPFLDKKDFDNLQILRKNRLRLDDRESIQASSAKGHLQGFLDRVPYLEVVYYKNRAMSIAILTAIIMNGLSLYLSFTTMPQCVIDLKVDWLLMGLMTIIAIIYYQFFFKIGYLLLEPYVPGNPVYSPYYHNTLNFFHVLYIDRPKSQSSSTLANLGKFISNTYFMALCISKIDKASIREGESWGERFSDILQSLKHSIMMHFSVISSYFILFSYSTVLAMRLKILCGNNNDYYKYWAVALGVIWFLYALWEYHQTRNSITGYINSFSRMERITLEEQLSVRYSPMLQKAIYSILSIQRLEDYELYSAYGGYAGYLQIIFAGFFGTLVTLLEVIG